MQAAYILWVMRPARAAWRRAGQQQPGAETRLCRSVSLVTSGSRDLPRLPAEEHECTICQVRYSDISSGAAIAAVDSAPGRYRRALDGVRGGLLRQRPEPGTWSMLEYACHVRDVCHVYTYRLKRARAEENPVLEPMYNDRRAVLEHYNDQDPGDVLAALAGEARQFAGQAALLTPDQHSRTVTRSTGEERTALWLLRQAAHEALHHHHDIELIRERLSP